MNKSSFISNLKYGLLVFIFLFAYGIKIYGIPLSVGMDILALGYVFKSGISLEFIRKWWLAICLIFIIVLYSAAVEALFGSGISSAAFSFYALRILVDGLLPAFFLAKYAKKLNIAYSELMRILIAICVFQLVVVLVMLFTPDLKYQYFINLMNFNDDDVIMSPGVFPFRGYGIGNTYLAWFPFLLSLIYVVVWLGDFIRSKILFLSFTILIIVLISLNARIAFLPIIITIIFYLAFASIATKLRASFTMILTIFLLFSIGGVFSVDSDPGTIIDHWKIWIWDEGFASLYGDNGSSTVNDLSNFSILQTFNARDWIFGRGDLVTPEISTSLYTDVGYLQTLYAGGLILSFLLYLFFILFFTRLIKGINMLYEKKIIPKLGIYIPYILIFSFFLGHFKLRIFEINEATKFLFLLTTFISVWCADLHKGASKNC
jgi:hypothetical protein